MSTYLQSQPLWIMCLFTLVAIYLAIILFKQSLKHRGEMRSAFTVAAAFLMPFLLAAFSLFSNNKLVSRYRLFSQRFSCIHLSLATSNISTDLVSVVSMYCFRTVLGSFSNSFL